jgi:hypothetical protein
VTEETREITLINGAEIKVRFIWHFATTVGPPYYPQAVRAWSHKLAEKLRPVYETMEQIYAKQLAGMVQMSPGYIFASLRNLSAGGS